MSFCLKLRTAQANFNLHHDNVDNMKKNKKIKIKVNKVLLFLLCQNNFFSFHSAKVNLKVTLHIALAFKAPVVGTFINLSMDSGITAGLL